MTVQPLLMSLCAAGLLFGGCKKAEITTYRIPKEKEAEMAPAKAGTGPQDMASTPVATSQGASLNWTAPTHWREKDPGTMRKGSYTVATGGAEADMSITAFPNDVGGELANVNRWRGQINLPPIGAAEMNDAVARHNHGGLIFGEVDLVGTGQNAQRILGAWVAYAGSTWFFKLMGPDAVVAREKDAFAAFIDTIKPATP